MNIAIVGATGNVGRKILEVLEKKGLSIDNLYLIASTKSSGKKISFKDYLSTQDAFGQIINDIGKDEEKVTKRIVTASPDVTVSTNLGKKVFIYDNLESCVRTSSLLKKSPFNSANVFSAYMIFLLYRIYVYHLIIQGKIL